MSTLFIALIALCIMILLIINPKRYSASVFEGLIVWAKTVAPACLPFFVLTKIFSSLNLVNKISRSTNSISKKLFNTNGTSIYIFLMSIFSGYPVGAKLIYDFYQNGLLSESQAKNTATFSSLLSPVFIFGTIASSLFKSIKLGVFLFLIHIASAVLCGLILCRKKDSLQKTRILGQEKKNLSQIISQSVADSVLSVLVVGGYIALFFLLADIVADFRLFFPLEYLFDLILPKGLASAITSGFLELTKGCIKLAALDAPMSLKFVVLNGMISFGGTSIFLQSQTYLNKCGINAKFYFLCKLVHTAISVLLAIPFCFLF